MFHQRIIFVTLLLCLTAQPAFVWTCANSVQSELAKYHTHTTQRTSHARRRSLGRRSAAVRAQ
eukprot:COSAG06_NODE_38244_length_425_cov_2.932515_1_plen_62_part_10